MSAQKAAAGAEGPGVIIIGAGIAGLSAGCYAAMNGFKATIFELHNLPGGLCTAWKRKGYTFDGCIDWLVGSSPRSGFHRIWTELGATQGRRFITHEEFMRIEGPDGKSLRLYTNLDRLQAHLLELAPEDAAAIRDLIGSLRKFRRMEFPVDNPGFFAGLKLIWRMLPAFAVMRRFGRLSFQDFAADFKNSFLREAFDSFFGLEDFPAIGMLFPLALGSEGDGGYPLGGSLEFSQAIERRFLDLGGEIRYNSRVAKILVEGGRAMGVRLADGTEHRADYVISAADGHATIFEMLEGKYADERLRRYYQGGLKPFPPLVQVSLGVARDFAGEPKTVCFPMAEPIEIAGRRETALSLKHYSYDPSMAPPGKSALTTMFMTEYEYWRELGADRPSYEAEKKRIANAVIAALDRRYPGLKDQVEVVDVATPLTFERYTGNWRGSFEGWLLTTRIPLKLMNTGLPKTLPGLANFQMIGQWTTIGGGLPPAARDGREAIKRLCKQTGREFKTMAPEA